MGTATRWFFAGTIVFGGLHALSSLYWGMGGTWLLETVGQWAIEWRENEPVEVMVVLVLIGIAKVLGVLVPILNARGSLPWPKVLRWLSYLGAIGLILYGGVIMVASWLALGGAYGEVEDRTAMFGHGFLWNPLFFAWGVCLLGALICHGGRMRDPEPAAR